MKGKQARSISVLEILDAISDDKSLNFSQKLNMKVEDDLVL